MQKEFSHSCVGKTGSSLQDAYGVDPTYVIDSSLYRATNGPLLGSQYRAIDGEVRDSGLPFGFFFAQGCVDCDGVHSGRRPRDFPILFDVNFNVSRSNIFATLIKDGKYIDGKTQKLEVKIPLLNFQIAKIVLVKVTFIPKPAGGWDLSYTMSSMDANLSEWDVKRDTVILGFAAGFTLCFLIMIWQEFWELVEEWNMNGHIIGYFSSPGNILDIMNAAFQLASIWTFIHFIDLVVDFDFKMHYDVYADDFAVGRLPETTREMGTFQYMIDSLEEIQSTRREFSYLLCVCLLLVCLQLVKNLDFHPRMGLITQTLSGAAADLGFFMILLTLLMILFAYLGLLIFGDYSEPFNTFVDAFMTCLQMLIQTYSPAEDIAASPNKIMAHTYYWSFQIIAFFVLLNALLAIIVEAYTEAKETASQHIGKDPLWLYIKSFFTSNRRALGRANMAERHILTLLQDLNRISLLLQVRAGRHVEALHPETRNWMSGTVRAPYDESLAGNVISKGFDPPDWIISGENGPGGIDFAVAERFIRLPKQTWKVARMPVDLVRRIMDMDEKDLKTKTRFYMANKGTETTPKMVLLDQPLLVTSIRAIAPTIHYKIALAVTFNILVKFGVDADLDGSKFTRDSVSSGSLADGRVSPLDLLYLPQTESSRRRSGTLCSNLCRTRSLS